MVPGRSNFSIIHSPGAMAVYPCVEALRSPVPCATRKCECYSITLSNRHQPHHHLRQTDEPVRAPFLAADTMVNEEQSVRVIFFLHRPQSRIIGPEESLLPVDIKIVRFRNI